ncbi:hypothetical protein J2S68_004322 [Glycomyces algeriensis]|uniref:Uncharacterized protein n=1 Tax=Glycomyces algeriensis TaxID=256037 RepID=A0A9W6G4Y8_9ACTN|nr:hypothetical protein [Glycomyces algeriensis]GLI40462.1 hypothetical protein GALLR39Z86_03120 [Glycomyces algeriensis]
MARKLAEAGTNTVEADHSITQKAHPVAPEPDAPAEPTNPAHPDKIP